MHRYCGENPSSDGCNRRLFRLSIHGRTSDASKPYAPQTRDGVMLLQLEVTARIDKAGHRRLAGPTIHLGAGCSNSPRDQCAARDEFAVSMSINSRNMKMQEEQQTRSSWEKAVKKMERPDRRPPLSSASSCAPYRCEAWANLTQ